MTDDETAVPYGEDELFRLLIKCGRDLESFVRKRLRDDPDTAKVLDQCQVDLIRAWKRRGELRNPRALLFRLAQQRATDRIRQLARRPEQLEAEAMMASPEFVSALAARLDVHAALAELPIRQREALLFVYGYGLSYRDAGYLMICPPDKVGQLLRLAKANMRKSPHLAGYGTVVPPEVHK